MQTTDAGVDAGVKEPAAARPRRGERAEPLQWFTSRLGRLHMMSGKQRAGALGVALLLANEVRGVIVVITLGVEPFRMLLAAG